jgi:hypothetical protein
MNEEALKVIKFVFCAVIAVVVVAVVVDTLYVIVVVPYERTVQVYAVPPIAYEITCPIVNKVVVVATVKTDNAIDPEKEDFAALNQ